MPEKETIKRAKEDLREGKSASTAAGEFVREEIDHVRAGQHGASSPQQAIAIGLRKARRAGIPLKPPARGKASDAIRHKAEKDYQKGRTEPQTEPEGLNAHSRSGLKTMQQEPKSTASRSELSQHARQSARRRNKAR